MQSQRIELCRDRYGHYLRFVVVGGSLFASGPISGGFFHRFYRSRVLSATSQTRVQSAYCNRTVDGACTWLGDNHNPGERSREILAGSDEQVTPEEVLHDPKRRLGRQDVLRRGAQIYTESLRQPIGLFAVKNPARKNGPMEEILRHTVRRIRRDSGKNRK